MKINANPEQKYFLRKNYHLTPIMMLTNSAIIVRDNVTNIFGEFYAYVLTADCKVQSLSTFVKGLPPASNNPACIPD